MEATTYNYFMWLRLRRVVERTAKNSRLNLLSIQVAYESMIL